MPAVSIVSPLRAEMVSCFATCGVGTTFAMLQVAPFGVQVWVGPQSDVPAQAPRPSQASPEVHALLSLQAVPATTFVPPWQRPFAGLHVPPVEHWAEAQTTGFEPAHTPAPSQVAVWVQASPSLQDRKS